jgi:hypothetical protein
MSETLIGNRQKFYKEICDNIHRINIQSLAREQYKDILTDIPERFTLARVEACIWGHIANGNKQKARKKLEKHKMLLQAHVDECIFGNHKTIITIDEGNEITGDEAFRILCAMEQTEIDIFEILITHM